MLLRAAIVETARHVVRVDFDLRRYRCKRVSRGELLIFRRHIYVVAGCIRDATGVEVEYMTVN